MPSPKVIEIGVPIEEIERRKQRVLPQSALNGQAVFPVVPARKPFALLLILSVNCFGLLRTKCSLTSRKQPN